MFKINNRNIRTTFFVGFEQINVLLIKITQLYA